MFSYSADPYGDSLKVCELGDILCCTLPIGWGTFDIPDILCVGYAPIFGLPVVCWWYCYYFHQYIITTTAVVVVEGEDDGKDDDGDNDEDDDD